jgi:anti-sigma-K factor RskA
MKCDELRDQYELFVLGTADEAEADEIRTHLGRKCDVCTAGVKKARELAAMLGATAPTASPSAALRNRIMASIGAPSASAVVLPKQGFRWSPVWAAVAGLATITAVYFEVRVGQEQDRASQAFGELRDRTAQLSRLNDALSIVNDTQTVEASFGPGRQPEPAGRVFVNPRQGVLFVASRLPVAPSGKTYEMWIVPKRGNPAPAGLFQSRADGVAMHLQPGAVDLSTAGAIAVTLEDAAGSQTPTMPILILAALPSPRSATP